MGARDPQPRRTPAAAAPLRRGDGLPGAVARDLPRAGRPAGARGRRSAALRTATATRAASASLRVTSVEGPAGPAAGEFRVIPTLRKGGAAPTRAARSRWPTPTPSREPATRVAAKRALSRACHSFALAWRKDEPHRPPVR